MKILLIISLLFLMVDVFLLDGHIYQNISLVLSEYSFFKWVIITIFAFVSSLMLFKLNINYFAELAKKDEVDQIDEIDEESLEESTEEEILEDKTIPTDQTVTSKPQDIGSKTLPKN